MTVEELLHEWQRLRSHSQQVGAAAGEVVVPPLECVQFILELQGLVSGDVLHQLQPGVHGAVHGFLLGCYLFGFSLKRK